MFSLSTLLASRILFSKMKLMQVCLFVCCLFVCLSVCLMFSLTLLASRILFSKMKMMQVCLFVCLFVVCLLKVFTYSPGIEDLVLEDEVDAGSQDFQPPGVVVDEVHAPLDRRDRGPIGHNLSLVGPRFSQVRVHALENLEEKKQNFMKIADGLSLLPILVFLRRLKAVGPVYRRVIPYARKRTNFTSRKEQGEIPVNWSDSFTFFFEVLRIF